MNKAICTTVGFIFGAAIGSAISWLVANKQYAERMAKELESYKKAVKELASKDDDKEDKHFTEDEQEEIYQEIARNYDSEIEQATKDQPIDYTSFTMHDSFMDAVNENRNFIKQAISEPIEDADIDKNDPERPYVISDEEYYDDDVTTKIELFLFDDCLLTDENWDPIEEPEKIIPMEAMRVFINNKDQDEIFTKSDARDCLYSICKQGETWEEFVQNHPIIIER